jgi:hypothetical protein
MATSLQLRADQVLKWCLFAAAHFVACWHFADMRIALNDVALADEADVVRRLRNVAQ